MAVQAVGSTPTSRHPSSYNLGIHRHPASAGLDRPHGGAATCICTGASAAGNTEARQVNTQARVESAPLPGTQTAAPQRSTCLRAATDAASAAQAPRPNAALPLASRSGLSRRIGSASARPLAGAARQTPTQLNIPRPQPIHPDTNARACTTRRHARSAARPWIHGAAIQAGHGPVQVSRCGAQR